MELKEQLLGAIASDPSSVRELLASSDVSLLLNACLLLAGS
jgi:hypothetical protein